MDAPKMKFSTKRWAASSMRISRCILILLLATSALSVSACGTLRTVATLPSPATVELEQPSPKIDPSLLAQCPPLPLATSGKLPELVRNHEQVTQLYNDCRKRHDALATAVKTSEAQEAARRKRARKAAQQREAAATPAQH